MIEEHLRRGIGMTSQRTRERLIQRLRDVRGIKDESVLEAMRITPRHLFVDEALASRAYDDTALPIGQGQTISQPYVVARMTEALLADGVPERVLEIGTGSGYQAAILAQLVPEVYTVERIGVLARQARQRFRDLRLNNIRLRLGDGYEGWADHGPFQAILLTAAPARLPEELTRQLAEGGRLVAPVGGREGQQLLLYRLRNGELEKEVLDYVSFVPMLGGTE
ncbi:MAG: protein-L-isoaspartate(D-aspartate) O-methyltransferase [Ectothiorhodospiraceae bacterium]|nr:protein-L-isoaspartate(D-aspartate) O-methyltransferase [Ectothiorhodospiraceae bacterium]MCH8505907.1 protein-L-isoaspartate(D-aspartate) O-methyltransferase [Ectothiorhodospiraceae bacterium]